MSDNEVEYIPTKPSYLPKENSIIIDLTNNHENNKRKHILWNDEETRAVKQGYKKYKSTKTLKWVKIKKDSEFSNALRNRTPEQIKDKIRTLKNQKKRKNSQTKQHE